MAEKFPARRVHVAYPVFVLLADKPVENTCCLAAVQRGVRVQGMGSAPAGPVLLGVSMFLCAACCLNGKWNSCTYYLVLCVLPVLPISNEGLH